ncbi:MAG: outer membrane beta-barrel protein, partial [Flavobacteriales bacterium]|nr:outer membrane beta-barrel protein [Flavobacteriales bacterium]
TTKGTQVKDAVEGIRINILNAELPVSFKTIFEVGDNFDVYASAGGYLGVGIIGVSRYNSNDYTEIEFTEDGLQRLDYGLTFGAGIEVKGFIVGASYDLGLANIDGSEYVIIKNRVLKCSLGYRFGWDN